MGFKFRIWQRQLSTKLWLRPALASLFSVLIAAFALWFGRVYEGRFDLDVDEDSLVSLLGIFASSMLSVATFTVSAIVTAASSVSNSTTHRAAQYVLSDNNAQLVLAAFISAFIYSIVGILSLKAFHYGHGGRFVLFIGLIFIVSFVLLAFINWVDHAVKLGRQGTTIVKLTDVSLNTITPEIVGNFGGYAWDGVIPKDSIAVFPPQYGYIVELNIELLQTQAEAANAHLIIATRPGEIADKTIPVAYIQPASVANQALADAIIDSLVIEDKRSPKADMRYNLLNLAETADKALSVGVNDPGTAIHIMNIQLQVLARWAEIHEQTAAMAVIYDRVSVLPITSDELVKDSFTPIARDGAAVVEIGVRLQKVLQALARTGNGELASAAQQMSQTALELANAALVAQEHKQRVAKAASIIDYAPSEDKT